MRRYINQKNWPRVKKQTQKSLLYKNHRYRIDENGECFVSPKLCEGLYLSNTFLNK